MMLDCYWLQTETSQIRSFGINQPREVQIAGNIRLDLCVVQLTILKGWFTEIIKLFHSETNVSGGIHIQHKHFSITELKFGKYLIFLRFQG